MKKKNILLWLEDKPEEIADLISEVQGKVDEVEIRRKPIGIKTAFDELTSSTKDNVNICGMVIDIMLDHVNDLEGVGLGHIKTPGGFEAGLAFIKHYVLKKPLWKTIPLCVFTMIEDDRVTELLQNSNVDIAKVKVIEKYTGKWEEDLLKWVETLVDKEEN